MKNSSYFFFFLSSFIRFDEIAVKAIDFNVHHVMEFVQSGKTKIFYPLDLLKSVRRDG